MGKSDRQRLLNKIIREEIAGGEELMNLKFEVQKWRSRHDNPDIGYVYAELCKIAEAMSEQALEWQQEEKADAAKKGE